MKKTAHRVQKDRERVAERLKTVMYVTLITRLNVKACILQTAWC